MGYKEELNWCGFKIIVCNYVGCKLKYGMGIKYVNSFTLTMWDVSVSWGKTV